MKTSVVAQLPLLTCTLTRTNCTQSQVDTCSIVQFYGKLKCAKEDGEVRNDLVFCSREATFNGFTAKVTSRALWPGFGLHRLTGSILTCAVTYLKEASSRADLPLHQRLLTNFFVNPTSARFYLNFIFFLYIIKMCPNYIL